MNRDRRRERWWSLLVLASIAAIGATHLHTPLNGDTALFHVGARHLLDGAVLYRDWWDLKGPGIYLVHALSILLFTWDALGLHLLLLVVMLGIAASLPALVRGALREPRLAVFAGLLCIAPYYLAAGEWHLSQPAVFAGAALYGGYRGSLTRRRAGALLGGLSLALAISIKLSAILPALALLGAGALLARRSPSGGRPLLVLLGFVGGLALVVAAVAWAGSLPDMLWTFSTWRTEAAAVGHGHAPWRLWASTLWYVSVHAGLLLLAAVGASATLRAAAPRDARLLLALAWVVAGYAGVGLERFAAWPFDLFLLSIPFGLLALAGLDAGWAVVGGAGTVARRAAVAASFIVVLAPFAPAVADRVAPHEERVELEEAIRETSLQLAQKPPWPIYVFGDPRHLLVTERPMAGSVHGWAWELQPPSMWSRLHRELESAPPLYVLLDDHYAEMMRERCPPMWTWLSERYEVAWQSRAGTWYRAGAPRRARSAGLQSECARPHGGATITEHLRTDLDARRLFER